MEYDELVFIGFVIDTAPRQNPDGSESQLGLPDPALDIAARCNLLSGAAEVAARLLPPPGSPPRRTLHIFMAPRNFFRGPAPYRIEDVERAIEYLRDIAATRFGDWLFAFGTIVGDWKADDPQANGECTFVLVQCSGVSASGGEGLKAVVAELGSGIDFIAAHPHRGGMLVGAIDQAAPDPPRKAQRAVYDRAGIFELAGLTWVVEIRADPPSPQQQGRPRLPDETEVQVQLVPTCGEAFEGGGIIARTGGFIFSVDGSREQARARLLELGTSIAEPVPVITAPVHIDDVPICWNPMETVRVDEIFASGPGSIVIFAPMPPPPAGTVPGQVDVHQWDARDNPLLCLTFYLIWDEHGHFETMLCQLRSSEKDFRGHKYGLPLAKDLLFRAGTLDPRRGSIRIELGHGCNGYDKAVYADIRVPPFHFQGEIMQFMNQRNSGKPMQKVW